MVTATTSTSATTSIVTALGGGSGIDMQALATNLANAQFALRNDRLAVKAETLDARISAASDLKSMLLGLSTSLGTRVREGDLSPQPQIANSAIARLSLTGTRQPAGTYQLEVTALAKAQTMASGDYADGAALTGSGTLTLKFGATTAAGFTEDVTHAPVAITIPTGAKLTDVAAAINAARSGVTAYVANTGTASKLVLKGAEGAQNGFVLEATEAVGDPGLANLAWTPPAAPDRLLATSGDAAFKVDGLPITSASNSVTDAVPGVKMSLTATNIGAPTTISFTDPVNTISAAMGDLTSALNEIASTLVQYTNPQSGELARDSGARALRRTMSQLAGTVIMPSAGASSARTLADLGLSTQRDGTFALDSARLTATLKADPQGAAAMFTTGLFGIYATIDSISRKAGSSTDPGSLGGSLTRYSAQRAKVSEEQAKLVDAQETFRARLSSRFAVADNRVGQSHSTLSFLQGQIDAWNAPRN